MVWLSSVLVIFLSLLFLYVYTKIDPHAALSGLFLIPITFFMEIINEGLGPFWIAQDSAYLIFTGLPVEKLLIYIAGGIFICLSIDLHRQGPSKTSLWKQSSIVIGIALVIVIFELVLNQTTVYRWVRPWTTPTALIYYSLGVYLLFRFYDTSFKTKAMLFAAIIPIVSLLATLRES